MFDGVGTRWVPKLVNGGGPMSKIYRAVEDAVDGACAFCASAFGVKDTVQGTGVKLRSDYEGHPSPAGYLEYGYEIVTF